MRPLREAKYGYLWITLLFFVISIIGHWLFGWFAYAADATAHETPIAPSEYLIEMMRDTLENWQSEFLQLMWQVAGLAYLLHVGSPQSREGDERKDVMLEHILRRVDPMNSNAIIAELEREYPKG